MATLEHADLDLDPATLESREITLHLGLVVPRVVGSASDQHLGRHEDRLVRDLRGCVTGKRDQAIAGMTGRAGGPVGHGGALGESQERRRTLDLELLLDLLESLSHVSNIVLDRQFPV